MGASPAPPKPPATKYQSSEVPPATYPQSAGQPYVAPRPSALSEGPARFTSSAVVDSELDRLRSFLAGEKPSLPPALACPRGQGCAVASCPRAFSCGALPNDGTGRKHVLAMTLLAVIGMSIMVAIMFIIVGLVVTPEHRVAEPNYLAMGLLAVTLPVIAGLIAYTYTSLSSRWQRRYIRALATAAQKNGLRYLPLVEVPELLACSAFPVIRPTSSAHSDKPRPQVRLAAGGVLQGAEVLVAEYTYHINPHDHIPMVGGAFKVAQAFVDPGEQPEQCRMYVLAMFPYALSQAPDFVITPDIGDFDAHFIRRTFGSQLVSVPNHVGRYLLAMADVSRWSALSPVLELLARSSAGWSIQVVGERLIVWKGPPLSPLLISRFPHGDEVHELVQFAGQVRQVLSQRTAGP